MTPDSRALIFNQNRVVAVANKAGQKKCSLSSTVSSFFTERLRATADIWREEQLDEKSEEAQASIHGISRRVKATELHFNDQGLRPKGDRERSEIKQLDASQL